MQPRDRGGRHWEAEQWCLKRCGGVKVAVGLQRSGQELKRRRAMRDVVEFSFKGSIRGRGRRSAKPAPWRDMLVTAVRRWSRPAEWWSFLDTVRVICLIMRQRVQGA